MAESRVSVGIAASNQCPQPTPPLIPLGLHMPPKRRYRRFDFSCKSAAIQSNELPIVGVIDRPRSIGPVVMLVSSGSDLLPGTWTTHCEKILG